MKILILALSGIGDALMFTPALNLLRKASPNAQIDALVMFKGVKDIYNNNPDLDKIFYYNFLEEGFFKSLKFILSLRGKYNTTINVYPSNRREYNVISFLLGAEKRVAVNYLRANTLNLGWLNNTTIKENDSLHNVRENIKLVEKIVKRDFSEEPKLKILPTEKDVAFAKDLMNRESISESDLVIGIHPGCATLKNHIKRRWEPEKFAKLARSLIQNKSVKVLIFGGPDEDGLKEKVKNLTDSASAIVIKSPDLLKTAAIMKRCNVFVTNDSSLMHVSAALGLNVVAIIGPTNSNYIRPWKTEHKIVSLNLECSPCFYYSPNPLSCSRTDIKFKCIKELDVDQVYNEVESFI